MTWGGQHNSMQPLCDVTSKIKDKYKRNISPKINTH